MRITQGLLSISVVAVLFGSAAGQCVPEWSGAFTPRPMSGGDWATIYDDGSESRLIVTAFGPPSEPGWGMLAWDGVRWSMLPEPPEGPWYPLAVRAFNEHIPPRLVLEAQSLFGEREILLLEAGGWTSTSVALEEYPSFELSCMESGASPDSDEIYLGGLFERPDYSCSQVLRWDGAGWAPLDVSARPEAGVTDLTWFDDGAGTALHASVKDEIDGVQIDGIARWDGQTWTRVGTDGPDGGSTLEVFDDGTGPKLWALARGSLWVWDGAAWTSHSLEPDDAWPYSRSLTRAVINGQPELCWTRDTSLNSSLWRWDGEDGQRVSVAGGGRISALIADDAAGGLIATGQFIRVGDTPAACVARWDGAGWEALGTSEVGNGAPNTQALLAVGPEGGEALGGRVFVAAQKAGGEPTGGAAAWGGSGWEAIGPDGDAEQTTISAFTLADLGTGPSVLAAAEVWEGARRSHRVLAWDGELWADIAKQPSGILETMAFGPVDGGAQSVVAGGSFLGDTDCAVVRLEGEEWVPVGDELAVDSGYISVNAMVFHDDGSGPALYAGGSLDDLPQELADAVLRWDGKAWTRVGSYIGAPWESTNTVRALCSADLGDGMKLYAGGSFKWDSEQRYVAAWDGQAWTWIGGALPRYVVALAKLDTPEGPRLAAMTDDGWGNEIYLWDGASWSPFVEDSGGITAMVTGSGADGSLYLGGSFISIDGVYSDGFARYGCPLCPADFNHDGTLDTRDFIAFLAAWAGGDDAADFDANGVLDTRDFVAYLNAWAGGC
jgi:hypothetical protein